MQIIILERKEGKTFRVQNQKKLVDANRELVGFIETCVNTDFEVLKNVSALMPALAQKNHHSNCFSK